MTAFHLGDNPSRLTGRLRNLSHHHGGRSLAVVVGGSVNALGVIRSLGRDNIPVVCLTPDPNGLAGRSRFTGCVVACPEAYSPGLVPALLELGPYFEYPPVLFLTHDFQVQHVSRARLELQPHYRFDLPPSDLVDDLLSKTGFFHLARRSGLPVPGTYIIHSPSELRHFVARDGQTGSWVVKPHRKDDAFEAHFGKAVRIQSPNDWLRVCDIYDRLEVELLVQSWIPGPDTNVTFCLAVFGSDGQCVLSFTGRKLRQYKPEVGNTAAAEPLWDPQLTADTIHFFARHHLVGIASLEFKSDGESGQRYAIEPTIGRSNLQSELAAVNGHNLPAAYYYGLTGEADRLERTVAAARCAPRHRAWVRFGPDVRSSWHYLKRGQLSPREWIASYLRPVSFAVLRVDDPAPFLTLAVRTTSQGARRIIARVLGPLLRQLRSGREPG